MTIENFPLLIDSLDKAQMPIFMSKQCNWMVRDGKKEFHLPATFRTKHAGHFLDAGFMANGDQCHFLGYRLRSVEGYDHGIFEGVNTSQLHRAIVTSYFPSRLNGTRNQLPHDLKMTLRGVVHEQLDRLWMSNRPMYEKMTAGFDLPFPASKPQQLATAAYQHQHAKSCWFDASTGVTRSEALRLLSYPEVDKGVLVKPKDSSTAGAWYQVNFREPSEYGLLTLKKMDADALDVTASLSKLQLNWANNDPIDRIATALEQGHIVAVEPLEKNRGQRIILSADPQDNTISLYNEQGMRLDPKGYLRPGHHLPFRERSNNEATTSLLNRAPLQRLWELPSTTSFLSPRTIRRNR